MTKKAELVKYMFTQEEIVDIIEESKKLKLDNADLQRERDGLLIVIDNMKKEIEQLEQWLDIKMKAHSNLIKAYKELNKDYEHLNDAFNDVLYDTDNEKIQKLGFEIDKLKKELSKREQGEYRYFGNDGEQDLYEDIK